MGRVACYRRTARVCSMHVTLRQLSVFEAVARRLSITRAAEELHLSQPAVSMQVRQLEEAVGLPLLERIGKRLFLTEAGRTMQRTSRGVAEQLSEAQQLIDDLKGTEGGRLHITVATTVNYFAARLLSQFCKRYPRVRVSLDVTNRETLLSRLEANETDIVLMGQPPEGLDLVAEPFMDNPLVVIAPPDHRLAGRSRIPLACLADETFLIREKGSGTRGAMERFFSEHGLPLTRTIEMTGNEAIKQSVEAGLGLGIVSVHTVELELAVARLTTLDVQSFPIARRWYVVHRRGKRLLAAARAFRQFVLDEAGVAGGPLRPS